MKPSTPYPHKDNMGVSLRVGDLVRILAVPDLSWANSKVLSESKHAFEHLVGRRKRIAGFNEIGWAEFEFRIRAEKSGNRHTVWIEPCLLRKVPAKSPRMGKNR